MNFGQQREVIAGLNDETGLEPALETDHGDANEPAAWFAAEGADALQRFPNSD
jgi:hypothetical protein